LRRSRFDSSRQRCFWRLLPLQWCSASGSASRNSLFDATHCAWCSTTFFSHSKTRKPPFSAGRGRSGSGSCSFYAKWESSLDDCSTHSSGAPWISRGPCNDLHCQRRLHRQVSTVLSEASSCSWEWSTRPQNFH
jgi:hypothetical protein